MSRTTRRTPQGWAHEEDFGAGEHDLWDGHHWWHSLYLSFLRGHRPGKDTRVLRRNGGWWDWLDIPGRNCANAKRYDKRRASKMRRREAKRRLKKDY
jgi:hypothetical protein